MKQVRAPRPFIRLAGDRRGLGALEFALVAPAFILLLLGIIGFGKRAMTQQAMEAAALQTARCVAIGASACSSAASYAVSTASAFGVSGLTVNGVSIVNSATTTTSTSACSPPGSNVFVKVTLTLAFVSPIAGFLANQNGNIVAVSCYPVTGS